MLKVVVIKLKYWMLFDQLKKIKYVNLIYDAI